MGAIIFFTCLGVVLGILLGSAITYFHMLDEANRLKCGDFTPDELQNLCHNLDGNDYHDFCDGCTTWQRKLFNGRSREDEWAARVAEERRGAADLVNVVRELRVDLKNIHDSSVTHDGWKE